MIVAVSAVQVAGVEPAELAWAFEVEGGAAGAHPQGHAWSGAGWRAANLTVRTDGQQPVGSRVRAAPARRPVPDLGLSHLCIQCRNLDAGLAIAQMDGFEAIHGPTALGTGYLYLYAHGASGMLLEMEGAPFAPLDMPLFWIGHVAWSARDGAALAGFYGALLDRPVTASSRLRGQDLFDRVTGLPRVDLEGWWVPGLNIGLEFWQFHNPPAAGRWNGAGPVCVAFASDDLEADTARALRLGARSCPPEADLSGAVSAPGAAPLRQFEDPEGNRFDLVGGAVEGLRALDDPGLLERLDRWHPARRGTAVTRSS